MEAMMKAEERIADNFRTGKGMAWGEHAQCLFEGTERFFRPGYIANLTTSWIQTLDGVEARLSKGGKVADVGCGAGASTIIMAKAYPKSRFFGFDVHAGSIDLARKRADAAGVADRVTFEVATAAAYPGSGYDLIAHFDCLHDMGDPIAAARHARKTLAPDGAWMIVEPFAGDKVEDNLNPVGRIFYAASTMLCVPSSLAGEGAALRAHAGAPTCDIGRDLLAGLFGLRLGLEAAHEAPKAVLAPAHGPRRPTPHHRPETVCSLASPAAHQRRTRAVRASAAISSSSRGRRRLRSHLIFRPEPKLGISPRRSFLRTVETDHPVTLAAVAIDAPAISGGSLRRISSCFASMRASCSSRRARARSIIPSRIASKLMARLPPRARARLERPPPAMLLLQVDELRRERLFGDVRQADRGRVTRVSQGFEKLRRDQERRANLRGGPGLEGVRSPFVGVGRRCHGIVVHVSTCTLQHCGCAAHGIVGLCRRAHRAPPAARRAVRPDLIERSTLSHASSVSFSLMKP
jgi:SAM-dependent methyltransferase